MESSSTVRFVLIISIFNSLSIHCLEYPRIDTENTTVTKGTLVRLNCSTGYPANVQWNHAYDGLAGEMDTIYANHIVNKDFRDRFSVEADPGKGRYDLLIQPVELYDSGTFFCIIVNNNNEIQKALAKLTVEDGLKDLASLPRDTVERIGSTAVFRCATQYNESVYWMHAPFGTNMQDPLPVYYGVSGFQNGYKLSRRFSIDKTTPGYYNLVISPVDYSDAGLFTCIDKGGQGRRGSAQLVVLKSSPSCNSNVSSNVIIPTNVCGLNPDTVELSCRVHHHGNIPIKVTWRNEENGLVVQQCVNSTAAGIFNVTSCILVLRGHENFKILKCHIAAMTCEPEILRKNPILSIPRKPKIFIEEDYFVCVMEFDLNVKCQFEWKESENGNKTVSIGPHLFFNSTGFSPVFCQVSCEIRNETCIVKSHSIPKLHDIFRRNDSIQQRSPLVLLIVTVPTILLVMILLTILLFHPGRRFQNMRATFSQLRRKQHETSNRTISVAFCNRTNELSLLNDGRPNNVDEENPPNVDGRPNNNDDENPPIVDDRPNNVDDKNPPNVGKITVLVRLPYKDSHIPVTVLQNSEIDAFLKEVKKQLPDTIALDNLELYCEANGETIEYGRKRDDGKKTLSDISIEHGSTLTLVMTLPGGKI